MCLADGVCAKCSGFALTSMADVDVQVTVNDGAVFQRLSGVHRVDHSGRADFITQAITGAA